MVHNAKAGIKYTANTTDPDGDSIYYKFSWGNGDYSNWKGPFASGETGYAFYVWDTSGTYDVTVKAKDEPGEVSGWSPPLTVHVNEAPVADFSYSPQEPDTEDTVQFTDLSYDPDGSIQSWSWEFGDGATSSLQNPSHSYSSGGNYTGRCRMIGSNVRSFLTGSSRRRRSGGHHHLLGHGRLW